MWLAGADHARWSRRNIFNLRSALSNSKLYLLTNKFLNAVPLLARKHSFVDRGIGPRTLIDEVDANISFMSSLPYVTAPGNVERALRAIQNAATPSTVSQDFVKTILNIPGGSGNQITSFLKKIGFVNSDGSPSELYKRFRNPSTAGKAAADALRIGYGPLYARNEYMHQLGDDKLRGLIIEETGQGGDSSVVSLVSASIKAIKKFADWSAKSPDESTPNDTVALTVASGNSPTDVPPSNREVSRGVGSNLSYTINLNLPASPDIAVFNAIFKSLKENLLKDTDD
jgi:hypothetical protein